MPEILLGVIPGLGGTQRLPRLIGPARAKNLIYTGRFTGAEEALRIGLVDQVVPDADVYGAATRLAGLTTLPTDFDIFSPRLNRKPCTTIWRGTGSPADIRNAGQ